jgi:hypothetical protein
MSVDTRVRPALLIHRVQALLLAVEDGQSESAADAPNSTAPLPLQQAAATAGDADDRTSSCHDQPGPETYKCLLARISAVRTPVETKGRCGGLVCGADRRSTCSLRPPSSRPTSAGGTRIAVGFIEVELAAIDLTARTHPTHPCRSSLSDLPVGRSRRGMCTEPAYPPSATGYQEQRAARSEQHLVDPHRSGRVGSYLPIAVLKVWVSGSAGSATPDRW